MWVALLVLLIVAVICATILIGIYIYYCSENEVGLFERPIYKERIDRMEERIRKLEENFLR